MTSVGLRRVLDADPRVAFALLFGSAARGTARSDSDLDVAVGLRRPESFTGRDVLDLLSKLEGATGRRVDLVLMHEAPPALAYRVFRDGQVLVERDRAALVRRRAEAILEYLDFKPVEELCAAGVIAAAARGR